MTGYVTCTICHQKLKKNDEECIETTARRYAHKSCLNIKDKIEAEIHEKMKKMCGISYSRKKVQGQIDAYIKSGKSVAGILKTLIYWYDVLHNDPSKANGGIAIVEYVYGEAMNYWYRKEQNAKLNLNIDVTEKKEEVVITPTPIKKPKKFKLFDIR